MSNLTDRLNAARVRARIYTETLKKCSCAQERIEFAESLNGPPENTDLIIAKALDRADIIHGNWISRIRTLANSCRDMHEFKDRLIGEFDGMDTEEMASIMAQTTFMANLTGRAEVLAEIGVE